MNFSKLILILLLIFCLIGNAFSQNQDTTNITDKALTKKEKRTLKKADRLAKGKFMITPFGAPAYTPELGGLLALGGLATFKTNRSDSLIQRSSLPFSLGYSTTGAVVANAILSSFWFEDKIRIYGDFWFKDMPDHYWGVGYQSNLNTVKSDSTTYYHRKWWWINPRILFQVKEHYFIGLNIDYNYTQGSNASEGVADDATYQKYKDKPLNSGLGIILQYDSRDMPVDAWRGVLLDLRGTYYSEAFGGDNNYQIFQLDYRQYQQVFRKGTTLAWQLKARIANGDIPYGEMSQLGSPFDLRGYTWGRYRDESMFFFLAEYRHVFMKNTTELSKHGAVAWIGSGTIFDMETLENNDNSWLPNMGIGYRLEIQPRMTLRLDFGIGKESSGFYFNFNQAF